jgi:hypothetical protein
VPGENECVLECHFLKIVEIQLWGLTLR